MFNKIDEVKLMSKLLIKNVELLHTPNGEMNYIAIEDEKIV